MSAIEFVGLFTVILTCGVTIAVSLIGLIISAIVVYRWAVRGYREELKELERNKRGIALREREA